MTSRPAPSANPRVPVVAPNADQQALVDLVDALSGPAFDDPEVGMTVWSFHTRDVDRSLDPHEVVQLMNKGHGVFVLELVYDEDYELVQRGDGLPMRTVDDLLTLRDGRFRHMVDPDSFHAKNPALAMTAPTDTKAKTSTPWHPSTMMGPDKE